MAILANIRTFTTPNYRVAVDALPEHDLDLSWDESGQTARDLDAGRLVAFCARARVTHRETGAELASDYLGGCIYKDFDAFMDHRVCGAENARLAAEGATGRCGSYFHDMIRTVCAEAREEVAQ